MYKTKNKNLIFILATIIVILGILYFLVYPLILETLSKPKAKQSSSLTIDKNLLKKIDDLKDNSVPLD